MLDGRRRRCLASVMTLILTNRPFRLLFSATAAANLGDGIAALAFPWVATLLTRDPVLIALVAFATRLPWFLFAVPVGVLVDRGDRRRLMIRADVFRFLLVLMVVALVAPGGDTVPGDLRVMALAAFAFLLGTAEVVRDNAAQTLLPALVPRDRLEVANGQLWSVEQVAGSFVGPPLAGLLIAWAVPAPFAAEALCFALAAWCVWCIAAPVRIAALPRGMLTEAREGWAWLRARPVLLRLALMLGLMNAMSMMVLTVLVLFSQDVLGLSAAGHGILLTFGAAGGVAGGLFGPRVIARIGAQWTLHLALVLMVMPFLAIGLTASPAVVAAALFAEMAAALLWNIVTVSYRQRIIPDALLGRVNAIYRFFGWGLMPFGALAAGWLVAAAEPGMGREAALRLPVLLSAGGAAAMAVYGVLRLRL